MFLAFIGGIEDWTIELRKKKTKTKSKVGAAHGMTKGEKRRLAKETRLVTKEESIQEVMEQKIQEVDLAVRKCLQGILHDYSDTFPNQLPYGPPPRRLVDHEIDTIPRETPPHISSYRISNSEME